MALSVWNLFNINEELVVLNPAGCQVLCLGTDQKTPFLAAIDGFGVIKLFNKTSGTNWHIIYPQGPHLNEHVLD